MLINVTGSSNMTLHEVNEASTLIQEQAHEEAHVIWGLVFDESMDEIGKDHGDRDRLRGAGSHTGGEARKADGETLRRAKAMPTYMKRNVKVEARDVRPKPVGLDLDDDRYDIPTFLRKQAD